ncbi:MAG: ATPase [Planctomycetes bacterium RBG_13_46_10]|nr:MAG: ATPase [Planctomycetes bacterium RBG_13_46_10]
MRIAIPVTEGKLSEHFGHCEQFAIIDADIDSKEIKSQQLVTPPPHEPGVLPKWLHGMGVNMIISSGMGQRAQQLFAQNQIDVVVGALVDTPQQVVESYLNGALQTGDNICDH